MNQDNARRIESMLSRDAMVIDVGGGQAAFPRADWIIDAVPFEQQGRLLSEQNRRGPVRFSRETWVQFDLCSRERWPFEDNQFDYAVCSHVLEDVRDPIWVCSELSRIAKAGYIEVPSRVVEQSRGIEHPKLAGYHHHRWLVSVNDGALEFRLKPHLLHVTAAAIVASVGFWRAINPRHEIEAFFWQDSFRYREVLEFDEQEVVREMCDWCHTAKQLPDLLVPSSESFSRRLRRLVYFLRLRMAWS